MSTALPDLPDPPASGDAELATMDLDQLESLVLQKIRASQPVAEALRARADAVESRAKKQARTRRDVNKLTGEYMQQLSRPVREAAVEQSRVIYELFAELEIRFAGSRDLVPTGHTAWIASEALGAESLNAWFDLLESRRAAHEKALQSFRDWVQSSEQRWQSCVELPRQTDVSDEDGS